MCDELWNIRALHRKNLCENINCDNEAEGTNKRERILEGNRRKGERYIKNEIELEKEGLLSKGRGRNRGKEKQELQEMGILDKPKVFDSTTDDALAKLEEQEYAAFKAGDTEKARAIGEKMEKIRNENS